MQILLGDFQITPQISDGYLRSIGSVEIGGTPLRNASTRWLPWFDSYEGEVFNRFRFEGIEERGDVRVLRTTAQSDADYPFRERRDSSGDLCFRAQSWDSPPRESQFNICFQPVEEEIDGLIFNGFKYWFEYDGETPIHRIVDRQTWEVGGNLDDLTLVLRNWLTPPSFRLSREVEYSTVGLGQWTGLLPGNLWGRWSLLPSFDMQYGAGGVLLGWFDEVSLIRSVVETNADENILRMQDLHAFEQSTRVKTNPKTMLYAPQILDATDALNLWTRVEDRERLKARRQFDMPEEEAPAIVLAHVAWCDFQFDSTYEPVIEVAEEFGADYVFIDPVWEHFEALRQEMLQIAPGENTAPVLKKRLLSSACETLDFKVAQAHGGEAALKQLCERAAAKNLKIISWIATHLSPGTILQRDPDLGAGALSIFAAKESGRHPDTGYPNACWPLNLDAPIGEYLKQQVLGVCERTGLSGFLWDSFCNLGWWHVDYSGGTMRPQFDKMAQMYAEWSRAGLYLMPEAIVTFSNHSCCGLHGGNVYADDLLGYSYNTNIALWSGGSHDPGQLTESRMLRGEEAPDELFRCIAHKRVPTLQFHHVPREEWDENAARRIRQWLAAYKTHRHLMQKRTVLKDGAGVLWVSEEHPGTQLFFSFKAQSAAQLWSYEPGEITDAVTGEKLLVIGSRSVALITRF